MDLNKIKKLQPEIDERSFSDSNALTNKIYFAISIFANIVAIGLEFLFLYALVLAMVPDFNGSKILTATVLVTGLSLFEYLKRVSIRKTAFIGIKKEKIIRHVPLILFTLVLISGSAWMGINGAHNISFKGEEINLNTEEIRRTHNDSINSYYNAQILDINDQIKVREGRLLEYEGIAPPNRNWTVRNEITRLNTQVSELKSERSEIEKVRDAKIKEFNDNIENMANKKTEDSKKGALRFIIIVAFIELIIVIGVVYNAFFDFKYYKENTTSESYIMLKKHLDFLRILYVNGKAKAGEKIPTYKNMKEKADLNNFIISEAEIKSYISLYGAMGIINPQSGNNRRFSKTFEESMEIITAYYNENK